MGALSAPHFFSSKRWWCHPITALLPEPRANASWPAKFPRGRDTWDLTHGGRSNKKNSSSRGRVHNKAWRCKNRGHTQSFPSFPVASGLNTPSRRLNRIKDNIREGLIFFTENLTTQCQQLLPLKWDVTQDQKCSSLPSGQIFLYPESWN